MKNRLSVLFTIVMVNLLCCVQLAVSEEHVIFSTKAISNAKQVQAKYEGSLMDMNGVRGVGIGQKNGQLGILVLLDEETRESQMPGQMDGLPVIVRVVGKIVAHQIDLGVSGGNDIICSDYCSAGTVGFKVCDNTSSDVVGWITNNHVAASGCPGLCPNNAPIGTNLFSPAVSDNVPTCSTTGAESIGTLSRFEPLYLDGYTSNTVDAAFVQSSDELVSDTIHGLDTQSNSIADPFVGQVVCKSGRTSGVTCGTVTGINLTIFVDYGDECGTGKFVNQLSYSPSHPYTTMSQAGDSGSPVVDLNNHPVSLNFAGDDAGEGFGAPIRTILEKLQVSLCSSNTRGHITSAYQISPSEGTIGTRFTISGSEFGTIKPSVYIKQDGGKKRKAKVISWSDTSITCIWNKAIAADTYDMFVQPKTKSAEPINIGTFAVMAPTIDDIISNSCSIGGENVISGKFFSTKKPKVYLLNTVASRKYACKVSACSMDPDTGESSLQFSVSKVPDLDSGNYELILKTKTGQASMSFCSGGT
jgi:hypothetical protein